MVQLRHLSTRIPQNLSFCVVGSGPAGFYTVDRLLKRFGEGVHVDLLESLPSPFGLVRSGVAPDHPETKNVIHQFTDLARRQQVQYFGNVTVECPTLPAPLPSSSSVRLQELRQLYHGVILACGAQGNRQLHIPGRDGPAVHSARDFVWWYNAHPWSAASADIDLSVTQSVAIVGMGNVALDCARLLLRHPEDLSSTDISQQALSILRTSAVKEVHLIGRRGPAQAAFTPKELRELLHLENIQIEVNVDSFHLNADSEATLKSSRAKKRAFELLKNAVGQKGARSGKTKKLLRFHFLRSPKSVVRNHSGGVTGIEVQPTRLMSSGGPGRKQDAVPLEAGVREIIPADMILESVGYAPLPMPGAPFENNIVPNQLGQVLLSSNTPDRGLFVCGWLKRGPTGIIGTNLLDAEQTVDTIVQAASEGNLHQPTAPLTGTLGLRQLLTCRKIRYISIDDWMRIDASEVERGKRLGKAREKFITIQDMLQVLD